MGSEAIRIGDLDYDRVAGTVSRGDTILLQGGRTLELFKALVDAAPEPLDAKALAQQVWQRDHVSDETLRKRISLLREALAEDRYVATLPDRRYRLAVEVRATQADPPPDQSQAFGSVGKAIVALSLVVGLIVGAVLIADALNPDGGTADAPILRAPGADGTGPKLVDPETGAVLEAPPASEEE